MNKLLFLATISLLAHLVQGTRNTCDISYRFDCGITDQANCEAAGCCWSPSDQGYPACFSPTCGDVIDWNGNGIGFTDEFYNTAYDLYKSQLNTEHVGAVMASPDDDPDYYAHWMRDGGLSIMAWLDINNNDYLSVRTEVDPYVTWVEHLQNEPSPNGIDIRVEVKFYIPSGLPFTTPWCRPQTDGPALRSAALVQYATILYNEGLMDQVDRIWPLIVNDVAWIVDFWPSEGCDLWEEISSDDFYWNRMAFVYALNKAADFADVYGEPGIAQVYRDTSSDVIATIPSHFKEGYLWETDIRPRDTSVLHAIARFGEYIYGPASGEAAATVKELADTFCAEYPVNQAGIDVGEPGVLFGRYPDDTYQGGNPWQLLTAVSAELFYKASIINSEAIINAGGDFELGADESVQWKSLLNLPSEGTMMSQLVQAQFNGGDAIMTRLWNYVQYDGGRIDEQIDEYTGEQKSAESLTWSYANVLKTIKVREEALARSQEAFIMS